MHRSWPIPTIAGVTRAAALMLLAGNACGQYAVSQLPALTPSPPTNIVLTVDDSGSMQWAYVPDGMSSNIGTRRFNAGTFNALAYNPKIFYPAPVMITSTGTQQLASSFTAAPIDGFNTAAGTVDLSTNYQPTSSYSPGSSSQSFSPAPSQDLATICSPAANCTGAPAYYYVYNATLTNCSSSNTDDNCYQYVKVTTTSGPGSADERGNFANWYSFYRIRHLMIASAAAITMADPSLSQARVTWRDFWTCTDLTAGNTCSGWDNSVVDNRIRTFAGTQQTNFYKWLSRVPAGNSTPTRGTWKSIGDYFSRQDLGGNSPYGINPNPSTGTAPSGEIACVQNYNITLTDGQWNGENDNFFGSTDDRSTTLPANAPLPTNPVQYTPSSSAPTATSVPIYSNDSNHDVLADIAFHYWSNNLRPDLAGSATAVAPYYQVTTGSGGAPTTADYWNPQNDPATWPHLVQITIGIGMTNTMTSPNLPWWGNNPSTQYLNATSNLGYYNLWNGILPWPGINNGSGGGDSGKAYDLWHAAINSRGLAFSAESPADLIGALQASLGRVKSTMAAQSAVAANSTRLNTGTSIYVANYSSSGWYGVLSAYGFTSGVMNTSPTWQTTNAGSFASPTGRLVMTSSAGTPTGSGTAAPTSQGTTLSAEWTTIGGNSTVLKWLLGDPTTEIRNNGVYRNRFTTILGDIVDSAPIFTWHENFGYASLPEGGSYITFLNNKGSGTGNGYSGKGMVYVGANDGMLHGFDAATGYEVFGYVPHDVIPNLPALADPAYAHRFYVDQTPYVGDACVGSGPSSCTWKTVLVGTTGAGGQSVFALDVTHPESMGTGNVMWDLDGAGAAGTNPTNPSGDPDLGYTIGKPVIARLPNGDWAAVFGNGYLSSRGCAVLFIVRLSDGAISKVDTSGKAPSATCTASNINQSNGLGPVTLAPLDSSLTTYAYAGDLQGNLWKFDLTSTSGAWKVAFSGSPLFSASPSSCVQAAGSAQPNNCQSITSAPALGPPLLNMTGTMVYFGTGRLFAAGDLSTTTPESFYGILDNGTTPASGTLTTEATTDNGSTRTVSFTQPAAPGWVMNLPDSGERVTTSPVLVDGFVVFLTQIPSTNSCTAGGSGWIMAMPATTGALGRVDQFFSDYAGANGVHATMGMPEGLTILSNGSSDKLVVGESGGQQVTSTKSIRITGRISWHELTQ